MAAAALLPPDVTRSRSILVQGTYRDQRLTGDVVDDLAANLLETAMHAQPRPVGGAANPVAHMKAPSFPPPIYNHLLLHGSTQALVMLTKEPFSTHESPVPSTPTPLRRRLTRFDLDVFAFVSNALALVRLRLSQGSDFRGKLADQLLVATSHDDVGLVGAGDLQLRRDYLFELVGIADAQLQLIALDGRQVADPDDLQPLFVPVLTPKTMLLIKDRVSP